MKKVCKYKGVRVATLIAYSPGYIGYNVQPHDVHWAQISFPFLPRGKKSPYFLVNCRKFSHFFSLIFFCAFSSVYSCSFCYSQKVRENDRPLRCNHFFFNFLGYDFLSMLQLSLIFIATLIRSFSIYSTAVNEIVLLICIYNFMCS